jgi:hypothetical protein
LFEISSSPLPYSGRESIFTEAIIVDRYLPREFNNPLLTITATAPEE